MWSKSMVGGKASVKRVRGLDTSMFLERLSRFKSRSVPFNANPPGTRGTTKSADTRRSTRHRNRKTIRRNGRVDRRIFMPSLATCKSKRHQCTGMEIVFEENYFLWHLVGGIDLYAGTVALVMSIKEILKLHEDPQSDDDYPLWRKFYTSIWADRASTERRTKDDRMVSSAAFAVYRKFADPCNS